VRALRQAGVQLSVLADDENVVGFFREGFGDAVLVELLQFTDINRLVRHGWGGGKCAGLKHGQRKGGGGNADGNQKVSTIHLRHRRFL
jgi:hypothetical protein